MQGLGVWWQSKVGMISLALLLGVSFTRFFTIDVIFYWCCASESDFFWNGFTLLTLNVIVELQT